MSTSLTKREFLGLIGTGLIASAGSSGFQTVRRSSRLYAYIGSWTTGANGAGGGGGIHVFSVNMNDGSLALVSSIAPELNAGYLCISPDGRFLYATDERRDYGGKAGAGGGVRAYAISPADGSLTFLNSQPSMGAFPAYICTDATGVRVITANHGGYDNVVRLVKDNGVPRIENLYDDGTIAMFAVQQNGALEPVCDVAVLERAHGIDSFLQASAHPHSVNFDPTNRFLLACDKGADRIYVYRVEPGSRILATAMVVSVPPGTAPRHSAFHPRLPYVFIINERESSLSSFFFDSKTGNIQAIQTLPTIPPGFAESGDWHKNMPADIRVHPNGKFVYGSNRGHDSIAIFNIDETSGEMHPVDVVSTGGSTPRAFNFEPSGKYLFAANQDSNGVVTFAIDPETGRVRPTGAKIEVPKPVCIKFAELVN